MTRWMIGSIAALAVGCAGGAPLDGDTGSTTTPATGTTMPTTGTTTEPAPVTGTTDTTTTSTTTSDDPTIEPEETTETTGEPTVLGEYYPFDAVHSPITEDIVAGLQAITTKGVKSDAVFAKVGAGITASANFLYCFADAAQIVDLPPDLQATLDYFNGSAAGIGKTSFSRDSFAAMAGWGPGDVITGMGPPLLNEVSEINPRFAVVQFGPSPAVTPDPSAVYAFADDLVAVVDALIAGGTVPILTTQPDLDLPVGVKAQLPRYNAFIRALAQGRKIPLIDLNLALASLPYSGLTIDGTDLSVALADDMLTPLPCVFNQAGNEAGYNRRNLVTLEALARARQVVVDGGPPPDEAAPTLLGAGTLAEPIVIPGLPFADMRSTADSPSDELDAYAGPCMAVGAEGPEYIYALTVDAPTTIRAMVFDQGTVDVDLYVMTEADSGKCVKRGDSELEGPLDPGTYYFSVDTRGAATPGEFAFVVLPEG